MFPSGRGHEHSHHTLRSMPGSSLFGGMLYLFLATVFAAGLPVAWTLSCVCVCMIVCVQGRERERERDIGSTSVQTKHVRGGGEQGEARYRW